jgi:hypothetical protein
MDERVGQMMELKVEIERLKSQSLTPADAREMKRFNHLPELWRNITKDNHPKHPNPELVKCNRCLIVFGNQWVSAYNSTDLFAGKGVDVEVKT